MTTRTPPTPDPRCGTRAGYLAHRRRGENACPPCLKASSKAKPTVRMAGSLPVVGAMDGPLTPCYDNPALWDPQNDHEPKDAARRRHTQAADLCHTRCPADAFARCEESKAMAGGAGVWAGRIPKGAS